MKTVFFLKKTNYLLLVFSLSLFFEGNAQTYNSVQLLIEDAIGQKDTIYYGAILSTPTSSPVTMGIDPVFGEQNIYGQPYNSLDARVIQRDSIHHECIRETHYMFPAAPNLYFPQNLDSKVDYRPATGGFNSIYNNFELFIHAEHYPITVRLGGIESIHLLGYSFQLLDSMCNNTQTVAVSSHDVAHYDTLFVITDTTKNTIIGRIEFVVPVEQIQGEELSIALFPNPAYDKITINGMDGIEGNVSVINALGQNCLYQTVSLQNSLELNLSHLNQGVYFIKCHDELTGRSKTLKFFKQE